VTAILRHNLPEFTSYFKASNSEGNFYAQSENTEWTTGFCTGQYWLVYEHTGETAFREAALTQVNSFLRRIENRVDVDHHDMGFLYTPSCVAAYMLTGSGIGKRAALLAADNLMARFHGKGQFFQAWGTLGARDNYRLIIDCLLNLPLLYWAADITGKPEYREKAVAHTKTSLKHLVREDNSTFHTYFFDPETGAPLRGVTHQGRRDGSAWARGQAWGVYGLALAYKYTRDIECIGLFYRVADFFISRLPKDFVPYWDLDFKDGDGEPKDSSAAAIAACGILEMAKYLPEGTAEYYAAWAKIIAASLAEGYAVKDIRESNGLLLHGVYAKSTDENPVTDRGVDECNTWGDYFWLELLTRLSKGWKPYW
jgi:unsaturated chondroitin disaccharide hydrolase